MFSDIFVIEFFKKVMCNNHFENSYIVKSVSKSLKTFLFFEED